MSGIHAAKYPMSISIQCLWIIYTRFTYKQIEISKREIYTQKCKE